MSSYVIHIPKKIYQQILDEVSKYPDKETGGVWLGTIDQNKGECVVLYNIDPGEQAIHNIGSFAYDYEYVSNIIDQLISTAPSLHLLGYWHNHLSGNNTFSDGDHLLNAEFATLLNGNAFCGIYTKKHLLTVYQVKGYKQYDSISTIIE